MKAERVELRGSLVRLEPLELHQAEALAAASAGDLELYHWSPIPQGKDSATKYTETALSWEAAGTALPFVIVRLSDNRIIGSSRFWNIEYWPWPQAHPQHGRA